MGRSFATNLDVSLLPKTVSSLDLETSGKDVRKAKLGVAGLKVYTWDEQRKEYLPGPYEHYAPTDLLALQQRLDALSGPIIGHYLFDFDYQILRRDLNLEHIIEKSVDTLHFLYEQDGGGEEGFLYGLDKLAQENFGEGKMQKASTIPKLLKDGKLAEVLVYNERDCDLTFRIWWKMVSERSISAGEARDDEGELFEVTYDLNEKDICVLTCATPRFTYITWVEQLERDGWIVMPPPVRKKREEAREQKEVEAREAASKRDRAMREFIEQRLRDDIPRKFAQSDANGTSAPLSLEDARAFIQRAGLPESAWSGEVVYQLLLGKRIHPAKLELAGSPGDPEVLVGLMKGILGALANDGYQPRYSAYGEYTDDAVSLAGPPPPPSTLAEQYVSGMHKRYYELHALFGEAGIEFEVQHMASDIHPAYMDAMNVLWGDGHVVFEDGSYVLDTEEIGLFQLQPKMLTGEEKGELESYIQDPHFEFTVSWPSEVASHGMALHRRYSDVSQGATFHMGCSCGWQSEPYTLEIDARAFGFLHLLEIRQQKNGQGVLRFRDHMLASRSIRNLRLLNMDEVRWIGLCACGWSCVERTEEDEDNAFKKHWTTLLNDPTMYADYLAFHKEEGLSIKANKSGCSQN